MRLDKKAVKLVCDGLQLKEIEKVDASNKDIDEVTVVPSLPRLLRLDLAKNRLTSLEALSAHSSLKWLSVAHNGIAAVPALDIPELQVLNIAGNKISGKLRLHGVPKLRALIANDNAITAVKGLRHLPELNTVILKNNSLTALGTTVCGCAALVKLSVAHNDLTALEEGGELDGCVSLAERLGHNDIPTLPAALSACIRLKIVDLGSNRVANLDDVKVLKSLPLLHQLTLHGCPVASADDYADAVLRELPLVEQLDGRRVRDRIRGRSLQSGISSATVEHAGPAETARSRAGDVTVRKRKVGGPGAHSDSQPRKLPLAKKARSGGVSPELTDRGEQRTTRKVEQGQAGDIAKPPGVRALAAVKRPAATVEETDSSGSEPDRATAGAATKADSRPGQSFLEEVLHDTPGDDVALGRNSNGSKHRENRSSVVKVIDVVSKRSAKPTQSRSSKSRTKTGAKSDKLRSKAAGIRGTSAAEVLAMGEIGMAPALGSSAASAWD